MQSLKSIYFSIYFFAFLLHFAFECPEPWALITEDSGASDELGFKNISKKGGYEALTWFWYGNDGGIWVSRYTNLREDGKKTGGFAYKKVTNSLKNIVRLRWIQENGKTTWWSNAKNITENGWKIVLCDGTNWTFKRQQNNTWIFLLGNITMQGRQGSVEGTDVMNELDSKNLKRMKRSEREMATVPPKILPDDASSTIERILDAFKFIFDFLFGEEDMAGNRSNGAISRFSKWVSSIYCNLIGGC